MAHYKPGCPQIKDVGHASGVTGRTSVTGTGKAGKAFPRSTRATLRHAGGMSYMSGSMPTNSPLRRKTRTTRGRSEVVTS